MKMELDRVKGAMRLIFAMAGLVGILALGSCGKNTAKNEAAAAINAGTIAKACLVESADHNSIMPASFAELLVAGWIKPTDLIDPRTGHEPMAAPDKGTDPKSIEADVDAHCDFYYTVAKARHETDPEMIILYDKSKLSVRIVAFADGHSDRFAAGSSALHDAVTKSNEHGKMIWRVGGVPLDGVLPMDLDGPPMK
jgi:hypothetical protein